MILTLPADLVVTQDDPITVSVGNCQNGLSWLHHLRSILLSVVWPCVSSLATSYGQGWKTPLFFSLLLVHVLNTHSYPALALEIEVRRRDASEPIRAHSLWILRQVTAIIFSSIANLNVNRSNRVL
jgi:hypothetical protein